MQLAEIFLKQGEESFDQLLRSVSIGKLKTFQLYERLKTRARLAKLNSENLRKAAPKLWARLADLEEDLATDLAQAILVSHLGMIRAVLDLLAIPNEDGFFAKDIDATQYLSEGWQQRVWEKFHDAFPPAVLLFYINHLGWELTKSEDVFMPAEQAGSSPKDG
jgi:hypothetical protein